MGSQIFKQEVDSLNVGTNIPHLKKTYFPLLSVPVPLRNEQKSIGDLYYFLSKKIEVNQKINELLEAVGEAVFKRWFVDFEFPNQEGKPYKTTGGKMKYSAVLGKDIPADWESKQIGELAKINERSISREFPFQEIEYVDINSVEEGVIKKRQILQLKDAPSRAKRIVKDDDVIISTVRPNLKHFALIQGAKPNTIVSTGFAVISAKQTSAKLLYYYLTSDSYTNYLSAIADSHTSTYPSFNPDIIYKTLVPHPTKKNCELLSAFDSLLRSMFFKMHNNNEQNLILTQLRDTLLPKLMSGKIRVPVNKDNLEVT